MDKTRMDHSQQALPQALAPLRMGQQMLILLLIGLVLIAVNWSAIATVNFELGDFAANSLLIQDAKSFALWKGNYSRVGFNHPGPAILYVLAAGEVLFYDWLHLAPSALSGQMMAIALYSAFWLTAILTVLRRTLASTSGAVVMLALFALGVAYLDYQIFNGLWFPHLYFFPFAALLVAGARLVDGHLDSLTILALASGFLINGHASFVAILSIIFLTVLAGNFLLARRHPAQPLLVSKAFVLANRKPLLCFVAILALFLLPLLIETVLRFPGPVADYARFSGHTKANTLAQAFAYMSLYWGTTPFSVLLAAALGAMFLLGGSVLAGPVGAGMRALAITFIGATLALLFYAKIGIDLLEYKYIGLFYNAVPALMAALALGAAWTVWRPRYHLAWSAAIVLALAGIVIVKIHKPVEYLPQYNQPEVKTLFDSLKAVPHHGRMVVDLDFSGDSGFVWTNTLGLQAYAKRQHAEFFCINKNWHISNTRAAQCTPAELASGQRLVMGRLAPGTPVVAQGMGMAITRHELPDLTGLGEVSIAEKPALFSSFILGSGWSAVESVFVWSEGKTATLALRARPGYDGFLALKLGAFIPNEKATQSVTIETGGVTSPATLFTFQDQLKHVRVRVHAGADGLIGVRLHIDHPISPKQAGLSDDKRVLGISLHAIKFEEK